MPRSTRLLASMAVMGLVLAVPGAAEARPRTCRTPCADTVVPAVAIGSPASGSSVTGVVRVSGTASDNVGVASVWVAVDGGAWQQAVGTTGWAWSWDTGTAAVGTHTLAVRALDAAGNVGAASEAVSVAAPAAVPDTTPPAVAISAPATGTTVFGTVAVTGSATDSSGVAQVEVQVDSGPWQALGGTSSWSWSWVTGGWSNGMHTLQVRATDTFGNVASQSEAVTVSNATTPPATQGSWVSPEGVVINVSSTGPWTIAQIYSLLQANALDLDKVGHTLTINVQDNYTSQTQTNVTYYMGKYTAVSSTMWLQGVNSGFSARPDDTLAHEYGHAWSRYWLYFGHQGDWSAYSSARWTTADGSLTLATDGRTGTSYTWQIGEIVADDYRLLFGSGSAVSERPTHLNNQIPDPRQIAGLGSFLSGSWRTP